MRLRRHATSGAGERESRSERSSRDYQEILPVEAATPRTARSGGVSGMHHRTTVRRADLIEGIVSAGLGDRTARFMWFLIGRNARPNSALGSIQKQLGGCNISPMSWAQKGSKKEN